MKEKKTTRTFRFSDLTIRRLSLIAKTENKTMTEALEFMIQEKSDFYGLKVLRRKEIGSGAFPYGAGSKIPLCLPEEPPTKKVFKRKEK